MLHLINNYGKKTSIIWVSMLKRHFIQMTYETFFGILNHLYFRSFNVKILVVDDSGFARRALIKLLNEQLEGWEIIDTGDGKQAVPLFKQHKPDLVFLDLTMPEVRGEEILEEIRTFDKKSIIIVVSADIQLKTRENVIALGANYMVNKPINAEKIAQALTNVMC